MIALLIITCIICGIVLAAVIIGSVLLILDDVRQAKYIEYQIKVRAEKYNKE